jgi:hypothetical protein
MVIDHANRLHKGIANGRPNKRKTLLFERF